MSDDFPARIEPAPNLYGMDRRTLAAFLEPEGVPPFHATQIFRWMYQRSVYDPSEWTDLSLRLRQALRARARVDTGRIGLRTRADDGTTKYRIDLARGGSVEAVYMVQSQRETLCVSSQVGCALACGFCLTGKMGLERHLDAGEILGQIALIRTDRALVGRPFNIVFMGMGEPLHNYDAVTAAVRALNDPAGFDLSRRRLTLSTAGLAPAIERLAEEPVRPLLAVSLNATTDALRDRLMPINRRYPLARLLQACRRFAAATDEPITFEYVLLAGVNDGAADLDRLEAIARGLPAKINLIPFNPVPGWLEFLPPDGARVRKIRDRLLGKGARVSVRWSRGRQARAACGQLAMLPPDEPASLTESPA